MPGFKGCLCAALLATQAATAPAKQHDVNSYVKAERPVALDGMLANIGSKGALAGPLGAAAGVVIASPSTVNPNYLYTWSRDSALTFKTVIDEFINGNHDLESHIDDYIKAQAVVQTLNNPSGTFASGKGLGEPKFEIGISRFNGNWGRPQRDGPALRSIALMTYVNHLIETGQSKKAKTVVWPIIANDLSYVGQYWNQTGFDLWEENNGSSFFTIQNQYRALAQGAQVAEKLGLSCPGCLSQAPEVLCLLQDFWNGTSIVANINTATVRSGRDANTLLGSIAVFDIDASCGSTTLQPCNSKILASHKVLVDSFRGIYAINSGKTAGQAAAIGRYPEDVYYKGNPWYLTTLAAAETLYDAVAQWKAQRSLTIDSISLPFFQDLVSTSKAGTYSSNSNTFSAIVTATSNYADGFVSLIQAHTPANGSLSEQFGKVDGLPLSAYDLTWSFASFVTMAQRRAGQYPASWGASSGPAASPTCSGTTAQGTYVPATAAGAPNNPTACTVETIFNVNASTYFGEDVFLVGSTPDTGLWNPANGQPMSAAGYTSDRPLWSADLDLDAGEALSYVYVRQESDLSWVYETGNRTLQVGACGSAAKTVEDAWSGPVPVQPAKA